MGRNYYMLRVTDSVEIYLKSCDVSFRTYGIVQMGNEVFGSHN